MKISAKDTKTALPKTDLLVVFALEKSNPTLPKGLGLPASVKKSFKGEFREQRLTDPTSGPAARVLLLGLGKGKELDAERLRRAGALAVKTALAEKHTSATIWISPEVQKASGGDAAAGQAAAEGVAMAGYSFTRHKSKPESPKLKTVNIFGSGAAFRKGSRRGQALGLANCFARELQDSPGNLMRPRDLVSAARKIAAKSQRIRFSSLNETAMAKLGMGSLLSVSAGSREPAYLIHLTYKPKTKARSKIAFVGKGLTFDAGGISLKPSAKMDEMKYDMSGGAAVLGLFHALTSLDVPFEVHGIVPTSENLPDGKATKPGDIVKAMNGKTIEVLNTDAEGRLILADALVYAERKVKADTIVDLATLTGAVIVALGHELTGVMSPKDKLAKELVAAGKRSGELVWRLPLLDVHKKHLKGRVGDLRNINSGQGAGSTAGAAFLSHFVDDVEWAHLDIAGSAWGAEERDYQGGPVGTGVGVRLLMEFLAGRQ